MAKFRVGFRQQDEEKVEANDAEQAIKILLDKNPYLSWTDVLYVEEDEA